MALIRTIYTTAAALCLSFVLNAQDSGFRKDSLVALPWQSERTVLSTTGSAMSVTEAELEKAPVQDLRRRLTGLFPGLFVTENNGSMYQSGNMGNPYMGSNQIKVNSRGFTQIACIIDDVPLPFNQYLLDPAQIESVTLLTDVADKAALGPIASYGAIYIKTKKGGYNTPLRIHADLESGVDFAGIWPEWVDGATYAKLNNQAREASGYTPLYSESDIEGFQNNDPYNLLYPNVDYKSMMMRNFKPVSRFSFNANAGSDNIKYNVSVSALNDNSLMTVGPKTDFNKINASSSISAKIGQYIEMNASFIGSIGLYRDLTRYGFSDYRSIPAVAFPLFLTVEPDSPLYDPDIMENASQIYGVSRLYPNNPYAAAIEGGYYTARRRSGTFNATADVDLGWLLKGLKSKTFINLSTYYLQTPGKSEDYIAYYWNSTDIIEELSSHTGAKSSSKSDRSNGSYQSLNMYERLSYGLERDAHKLDLSGTFYMCSSSTNAASYNQRQLYAVGSAKYAYSNRYFVDLVTEYAGSSRYYKSSRFAWFPALGASWVVSNEQWLKDSPVLSFLKLHFQAGKIGDADVYDTSNYLWQGKYDTGSNMSYGPSSSAQWFGSKTKSSASTVLTRIANYDLTWPTISQIDAGVDVTLFNSLDIRASWYRMNRQGIIEQVAKEYSDVFGYLSTDFNQNYSARLYSGYELALRYHKTISDFSFSAGVSARHWDVTYKKVANNFYLYDYQNVVGRSTGDVEGYHCIGKFTDESDIASSALYSSDTQTGDLKYEDKNSDGVVDANDKYVIGNTNPDIRYTVSLDLNWRNFNLSVIGEGIAGGQMLLNNGYFWSGWGDGVYSQFVAENIGGAYPRLSFDQAKGNFITSDFWLCSSNYFKIKSAELGYTASFKASRFIKSMKVSLRGGNLLTLTSVKYVDPEAPDSGISDLPLFRTLTAGVKLNF